MKTGIVFHLFLLHSIYFIFQIKYALPSDFEKKYISEVLSPIKSEITKNALQSKKIFIVHADEDPLENVHEKIIHYLKMSGLDVIVDNPSLKVGASIEEYMRTIILKSDGSRYDIDLVLILCTEHLCRRSIISGSGIEQEISLIQERIHVERSHNKKSPDNFLISLLLSGNTYSSVPLRLRGHLHTYPPLVQNGFFNQEITAFVLNNLFYQNIFPEIDKVKDICLTFNEGLPKTITRAIETICSPYTESPVIYETKTIIQNISEKENPFYYERRSEHGANLIHIVRNMLHASSSHIMPVLVKGVYVVGTGGTGKSYFVTRYAYESFIQGIYKLVWFVQCDLIGSYERDMCLLYDTYQEQFGISESTPTLNTNQKIAFIKKELENADFSWLIVYDNVPDNHFMKGKLQHSYKNMGHILITSRYVEKAAYTINMNVFTSSEAVSFMNHYFNQITSYQLLEEDTPLLNIIVGELLHCLPLALVQAASYIVEQNILLSEYINIFHKQKEVMLSHENLDEFPQAVYTTFLLAYNKLSTAKELVHCLCYVSADYFPLDTLKKLYSSNEDFQNAYKELQKYGLIKCYGSSFLMHSSFHRLYQNVCQTIIKQTTLFKSVYKSLFTAWNNYIHNFSASGYEKYTTSLLYDLHLNWNAFNKLSESEGYPAHTTRDLRKLLRKKNTDLLESSTLPHEINNVLWTQLNLSQEQGDSIESKITDFMGSVHMGADIIQGDVSELIFSASYPCNMPIRTSHQEEVQTGHNDKYRLYQLLLDNPSIEKEHFDFLTGMILDKVPKECLTVLLPPLSSIPVSSLEQFCNHVYDIMEDDISNPLLAIHIGFGSIDIQKKKLLYKKLQNIALFLPTDAQRTISCKKNNNHRPIYVKNVHNLASNDIYFNIFKIHTEMECLPYPINLSLFEECMDHHLPNQKILNEIYDIIVNRISTKLQDYALIKIAFWELQKMQAVDYSEALIRFQEYLQLIETITEESFKNKIPQRINLVLLCSLTKDEWHDIKNNTCDFFNCFPHEGRYLALYIAIKAKSKFTTEIIKYYKSNIKIKLPISILSNLIMTEILSDRLPNVECFFSAYERYKNYTHQEEPVIEPYSREEHFLTSILHLHHEEFDLALKELLPHFQNNFSSFIEPSGGLELKNMVNTLQNLEDINLWYWVKDFICSNAEKEKYISSTELINFTHKMSLVPKKNLEQVKQILTLFYKTFDLKFHQISSIINELKNAILEQYNTNDFVEIYDNNQDIVSLTQTGEITPQILHLLNTLTDDEKQRLENLLKQVLCNREREHGFNDIERFVTKNDLELGLDIVRHITKDNWEFFYTTLWNFINEDTSKEKVLIALKIIGKWAKPQWIIASTDADKIKIARYDFEFEEILKEIEKTF